VSPGASPDGQDASSAVELCIGFTTPKINQAYILNEGIEHLRCGLEMLIADGLTPWLDHARRMMPASA
jgi:hypothetical protein